MSIMDITKRLIALERRFENFLSDTEISGGQQLVLSSYDAEPSRSSGSEIHGGILSLATAQSLSGGSPINVTKGIGKMIVIVNAGSDISGTITVTGTTVNRETGVTTASDTNIITIDSLTTDSSTTDANGNTKYTFSNAYITSNWFVGPVALSTTDLTLTDVDIYHISFEQFNDSPGITAQTFDANIFTTNNSAEFDAYLYVVDVLNGACDISILADLHVGADGITAIADRYWRLRRGNIDYAINGERDGVWVNVHYSNSPAYVEDVTIKVWASRK